VLWIILADPDRHPAPADPSGSESISTKFKA
jgi:hypothetical protein